MRRTNFFATCLAAWLVAGMTQMSHAQYALTRSENSTIAVSNSDGSQRHQLSTGGFNNVQVSSADVRGTGRPADYYVFDRAGDVHNVLTTDLAGGPELIDLSALTRDWPRARFFSLMRDYNRDGVPDLFVSSAESGREGIWVYTGRRQGDRIAFTRADFGGVFGEVLAYGSTGADQLLYTLRTDIPAIQDLDGDGDLDILAFDASGSYIWYYRNISVGSGPNPQDHLRFELADRCYGGVYENSFSAQVVLAGGPGLCAQPLQGESGGRPEARGGIHPGSTLTPYDADCDGDLDLLLGDVAASSLALLTNSPGPSGETYYSSVETNWPNASSAPPANVDFFPAAFVIEPLGAVAPGGCPQAVLVAPSNTGGGEDRLAQLYYTTDVNGRRVLSTRSLFSSTSFDHGTGSHFAFADLNGDGEPELLVGNESAYDPSRSVPRQSSLRFYLATGPEAYREESPDWLVELNAGLPEEFLSLDPAFADLNGDGLPDLVIGNSEGGLSYVENRSVGASIVFGQVSLAWQGINVGIQSSPAVADVNGDGLPDLVVGERAGNLNLFLNRGSTTSPRFNAEPDDDFYGAIDVRTPGFNASALSRPTFFTPGGPPILYVGSGQGRLVAYTDLPQGPGGTATLVEEIVTEVGNQLDPVVQQVTSTASKRATIWLGNQRGGFAVFTTSGVVGIGNATGVERLGVFPNPTLGSFRIDGLPMGDTFTFRISDLLGRPIAAGQLDADHRVQQVLPQGAYAIEIRSQQTGRIFLARVIVQ